LARTLGTTGNHRDHAIRPEMSNIMKPTATDSSVPIGSSNGGDLSTAPTTSTTISPNSDHDHENYLGNNGRLSPTASRSSSHNHHRHHLGLGHHHDHQDASASNSNSHNDEHPHRKPSSVVKRMTTGLFTPEKKIKRHPGWKVSFLNLAKSSWINLLLVFIPVS
jgi:hypothetical protein